MVLQDRLAEISQNFAENRDANYRKQLQQYQADINFINNAQLYGDKPLLEPGEEDEDDIGDTGAAGVRHQPTSLVNGNARLETPPKTGRYAARFVQEINDAIEERDANLTATAVRVIPSSHFRATQDILETEPELTLLTVQF